MQPLTDRATGVDIDAGEDTAEMSRTFHARIGHVPIGEPGEAVCSLGEMVAGDRGLETVR